MRSRNALLAGTALLFLAPLAASAAVGNSGLARYLVADPIGGSPVSRTGLGVLVAAEQRAMSTLDLRVVVAAQGWRNTNTHAQLVEVAIALSQDVPSPGSNATETVTSACGAAGGSATAFQPVAGVANAYETACRSVATPTAKPVRVIAFVKENVVVIFFGSTSPSFSTAALNTVVKRQYERIPGSGISSSALVA